MDDMPTPSPSDQWRDLQQRRRGRLIWLAVIIAGAAAVFFGVSEAFVKDKMLPKRWGVVEPGSIYRSGQLSEQVIDSMLKEHSIDVVVNLTGDADDPVQQAQAKAIQTHGAEQVRCPLAGDGTGDIKQYARAIAAIDQAVKQDQQVLVHCAAGTQRTGGVIATWRLLVRKQPQPVVYGELAKYDWNVKHDKALTDYVNAHMGELADLLVEKGVIDVRPDPLPKLAP